MDLLCWADILVVFQVLCAHPFHCWFFAQRSCPSQCPSPDTVGKPDWWPVSPNPSHLSPSLLFPFQMRSYFWDFFSPFFFFERSGSLKKIWLCDELCAWLLCFNLHLSALHLTDTSWNSWNFNGSFPVLMCVFPLFLYLLNCFWLDQKGRDCVSTHTSIFTWNSQSHTAVKPHPGECIGQGR